jgi:hypothetical protein
MSSTSSSLVFLTIVCAFVSCGTSSFDLTAPLAEVGDAGFTGSGGGDSAPIKPAAPDGGRGAPLCGAPDASGARRLSQMGLYQDLSANVIASGVLEYSPAFALWSDGAEKRRFLRLPANVRIDTSDMDHWRFPVGTRAFKEFSLNGKRLETRLIERIGSARTRSDYLLSSFIWSEDQCDAVETFAGATNVLATTHDVPNARDCNTCHDGEPGRILGFSAIQLSKPGRPPTLLSLSADGLLTNVPPSGIDYPVPGDPTTRAALGYLHANCGHCHNPDVGLGRILNQYLRLNVADVVPETTPLWRSTVNRPSQWFHATGVTDRIAAHAPDASAIPYRMGQREGYPQMPPIGTKAVDNAGLATVRAWISIIP